MTDNKLSTDGRRHGMSPAPREKRTSQDRREANRRIDNRVIDFTESRVGERRKNDRRTHKLSKSRNLIRYLKEKGLYPHERAYDQPMGVEVLFKNKKVINLASVDYFNFAQHPAIKKSAMEAINKYGAGGFSSRFTMGYFSVHQELEEKLAEFMGKESVLIFNSGYLANLAVITSIMPKDATIFLDQKSHISIHHACQLSQKTHFRFANNDMADLEKALQTNKDAPNKWIVTLGVFSSTGYLANLKELAALARKYQARIFIDDAHGIGIYGDKLRGAADFHGVLDEIDLIMCPFQMAFGNIGAFVAGKDFLLQATPEEIWPYTYTFNIPPLNASCILKALELLSKEGQEYKKRLLGNATYLRKNLVDIGYKVINPDGHIIPIVIGAELKMCEFVKFLFDKGVWVQPFYFPAVPKGQGTIRITCTAGHTQKELDQCIAVFAEGYSLIKTA